ncbi:hypothetical protein BGX30_012816 [Mortierella sp. GBA39]|nr:hypothetical protein BGX30_012816 [Mortierella sp. GBA39]
MIPVSRQKVVPVPVSAPMEVSNSVSSSWVVEVPQPQPQPHHAVFVSHTSAPVLTVEQQLLHHEPGPALVPGSSSSGKPEEPHPLTIHTIVSGPESPSPILAAWSTPQHPNPDYLAPYHPSLHKNVHNWSQILLDQLRQKSASSPEELEVPLDASNNSNGEGKEKAFSVQAALSSSVSGIVPAVPATFEGFSSASIAIAPSSDNAGASSSSPSTAATRRRQQVYAPAPIDKHFLFQTHHREQQSAQQQKPPQSGNAATAGGGQQSHKDKNKDTDDMFNYLVVDDDDDDDDETLDVQNSRMKQRRESLVQIVSSAERECEVVAKPLSGLTAQPAQPTGGPPPDTSTLKAVPKMMKVINRIKANKAQEAVHLPGKLAPSPSPTPTPTPAPVPETVAPIPADMTPAVPVVAVPPQKQYFNGARIHPKLLELYEITDHVLGVGTFATVREIRLKSSGQSFALKIILKKTLQGKGAMLDTEIAVLSKVRHPNCVSLLEMFETEDAVFLVTDLAEGGELFEQLLQKGCYTEGDAARLVREILLGVEYLHSMEIVHRDLKPENLLFLDKSENARLLITDFGLSKVLTSGEDVLMTACGTPGYVAPEVLEQIGHGKPVDMWSLGVIAYTLLCGYTPFWGDDQQALFENIIAGQYQFEEEYWREISPLAKNFINTLLVRPAEIRSTATQALAHPWFRAVLDQDLSAPASPQDSVNLLPAVRKNFNARTVFKKAVRAVGILRRMQAAPPSQQREQQQQQQQEAQSPPAGAANITKPLGTSTAAGALSGGTMVQGDSDYTLPSPPPPNNSFAHPHQAELVVTVNGTAGRNQAKQLEQERMYFKDNHANNWSFHDVVTAAMVTNGQGLGLTGGNRDGGEGEGSGGKEAARNDSEDQLRRVSDVLEDLSATREP